MDEQNKGFRGAFLRGFNREDVLHYIESTDQQCHEREQSLQDALTESQSALQDLRTQNATLTQKNAELLERLGQMTLDTEKIRTQLDEIERNFTMQETEVEVGSSRVAELSEENLRLRTENKELAEKCGEYTASKEKIAEMELAAYRRAKAIEEDAKTELIKLREQSMTLIASVRKQLDQTKDAYRIVLEKSQRESAEMTQKANRMLSDLDRISGSLGKTEEQGTMEESAKPIKNSLKGFIQTLRTKTEE